MSSRTRRRCGGSWGHCCPCTWGGFGSCWVSIALCTIESPKFPLPISLRPPVHLEILILDPSPRVAKSPLPTSLWPSVPLETLILDLRAVKSPNFPLPTSLWPSVLLGTLTPPKINEKKVKNEGARRLQRLVKVESCNSQATDDGPRAHRYACRFKILNGILMGFSL